MGKDKLRKYEEIKTFPNVYRSKNHFESRVLDNQQTVIDSRGKWSTLLGNDHPITLELACGKGHYARGLAQRFPNQYFIGVDLKGNRIWKGAKLALENKEENVSFLRARIEFLERYFAPNEINEIWITFPDPQPKKAKKRLTAPRFLDVYKKIIQPEGLLHLKTDSTELYTYSLEVLEERADIQIIYTNDDIYASDELYCPELAIKTFYEERHLENQRTIKYIRFRIKP